MPRFCHGCGAVWEGGAVGRGDLCPSCGRPLRCCLNCAHYDPLRSRQCRIPDIDLVADKAAANFCEEFVFRELPVPPFPEGDGGEGAKAAWESLFKR